MAPRKEISVDVRNLVIQHRKEKKSYGEISKILNLSRATVQTIVKNFKNSGSTENKPRSGRPSKLSRRDVSLILKEVDKNPKVSAPKLAEDIASSSNKCVHPRTIQRALNKNGFHSRTPRKKPLISEKKTVNFAWSSPKHTGKRGWIFGKKFCLQMSRSLIYSVAMEEQKCERKKILH